jgi:uncharacterized membrane protein
LGGEILPKRILYGIVLILILGAAARILNTEHWTVWTDEGWSTWAASDHDFGVILDKVAADRHPPLYFLSLSAWWTVAGDSRLALRFLSIASGIVTIALVYRITADIFDRSAAAYAALLYAVLNVAIYYAQEIRHYGWLMLCVALMTLLFERYLHRPRPALLIGYCLSIALMLYVLYIGVLILPVHALIGLVFWRRAWRHKISLVAAWVGAAVLYIPWLFALSRQFGILTQGIDGLPTSYDALITLLGILFGAQFALSVALYALGLWRSLETRDRSARWLSQSTVILSGGGCSWLCFLPTCALGCFRPGRWFS